MPELYRFRSKYRICMYPDHAPPHFHVYGPGCAACFTSEGFELMRGNCRRQSSAKRWTGRAPIRTSFDPNGVR